MAGIAGMARAACLCPGCRCGPMPGGNPPGGIGRAGIEALAEADGMLLVCAWGPMPGGKFPGGLGRLPGNADIFVGPIPGGNPPGGTGIPGIPGKLVGPIPIAGRAGG